jgi:hypothetical protein
VLDVTRDPAVVTLGMAGVTPVPVDVGSREKRRGRPGPPVGLGPWPGAGPAQVGRGREGR